MRVVTQNNDKIDKANTDPCLPRASRWARLEGQLYPGQYLKAFSELDCDSIPRFDTLLPRRYRRRRPLARPWKHTQLRLSTPDYLLSFRSNLTRLPAPETLFQHSQCRDRSKRETKNVLGVKKKDTKLIAASVPKDSIHDNLTMCWGRGSIANERERAREQWREHRGKGVT
jgi:hypothetical protein